MRPRKLVILCCRNLDQASVFALVARHRLPIRIINCYDVETALNYADQNGANLLLFLNCYWNPSPEFDISLGMAKVLFNAKRTYPILILDKLSTEQMKPYVSVPMIWSHACALELIRLNLVKKRGPKKLYIVHGKVVPQ